MRMDNVDNDSVKTGEVADNPKTESHVDPMDNEDFWNGEEDTDDVDTDTSTDDTNDTDDTDDTEDSKPVVKQVDKKTNQSNDDNAKYAAARRESENQLKATQEKQNEFAKGFGYTNFDEMVTAAQRQKYVESGYTPEVAEKMVHLETYERDLKKRVNAARIIEEKAKLKNEEYFKEFESDIDEILSHNQELDVGVVFNLVKGQNIKRIVELSTKSAKQKTLNDINSKKHIQSDGGGVDLNEVHVDESEWNFYRKLNPKAKKEDWVKFLKKEKRR